MPDNHVQQGLYHRTSNASWSSKARREEYPDRKRKQKTPFSNRES